MPDDDELIIVRLGIEPDLFEQYKTLLFRGWWKASDGRLYHQTITQFVLYMLGKRGSEKDRKAEYRSRKEAERLMSEANEQPNVSHGTDAGRTMESHGSDDTRTRTRTRTRTSLGSSTPASQCSEMDNVSHGTDAGQVGTDHHESLVGSGVAGSTDPMEVSKMPLAESIPGLQLPGWMPVERWGEFVAMRKAMGKSIPFTPAAANGIVRKLAKMHTDGHDVAAILEKSTVNGWRDVFEPKPGYQGRIAGRAEPRHAAAGRSLYGSGPAAAGEVFDV